MINTVLFDFGGTLFYEKRKIPEDETLMAGYVALGDRAQHVPFEAFKDIFLDAYRKQDQGLAKKGMEISIREFSTEILGQLGIEATERVVDSFLWGRFQPHSVNDEMFDDVLPVLKELKPEYKVGLVSNAQPHGIQWYLDKTGIVTYFDEIIVSGGVGFQKPNPRIFRLAAESICSDPEECLMVGDSPTVDAAGAQAVGMVGIVIDREGRLKASFPHLNFATDLRQILKWVG